MPDGATPPLLRVPQIFYGLEHIPEVKDLLNQLIRSRIPSFSTMISL